MRLVATSYTACSGFKVLGLFVKANLCLLFAGVDGASKLSGYGPVNDLNELCRSQMEWKSTEFRESWL